MRSTQPHGPHGSPLDDERWEEAEIAPPCTAHSAAQRVLTLGFHMTQDPISEPDAIPSMGANSLYVVLALNLRGREEGARPELTDAASLRASNGGSSRSYLLTSSAADSPVKTSASPADAPGSPVNAPACSSSSPESQMSLFAQADGSSLRTSPACSVPRVDEISPSYSARWATSGFTTSPGECWTADTSECPSGGDASSSLADVLLETVPDRFFLSPRAAAGILRRAEKRGRELPAALQTALSQLARSHTAAIGDSTATPRTSSSAPSRAEAENVVTGSTPKEPQATISSPTPSPPRDSTPARTGPDEAPPSPLTFDWQASAANDKSWRGKGRQWIEHKPGEVAALQTTKTWAMLRQSSVRRLTPTECERLQGFPDGWTIP